MKYDIHSYATGVNYNGPQVLKFVVVRADFDQDWDSYDLLVWMTDESRNLAYAMKMFMCSGKVPTGEQVHRSYMNGGHEILMDQELKQVGLINNNHGK